MAGRGATPDLVKAESIPKPEAEQPEFGAAASAASELDHLVARINKQELVSDVANVVCKQVEAHTAEVVGEVWNQGKVAMLKLQREQAACAKSMQGQLQRCTESFVQLQRENAALRMRLEAMARYFQMLQWTSEWGSPCQHPGSLPFGHEQYRHLETQLPQPPQPSPSVLNKRSRHLNMSYSDPGPPLLRPSVLPPTPEEGVGDIEEDSASSGTPWGSPQDAPQHAVEQCVEPQALPPSVASIAAVPLLDPEEILQDGPPIDLEELLQEAPAPSTPLRAPPSFHSPDHEEVAEASEAVAGSAEKKRIATTPSTAATATAATPNSPTSPIGLTLRRAQGQPLGIKVREVDNQTCLFVESVQPGSVAGSWNKQCAGENREIKPGDRLVSVNGATMPVEMRKQCMEKLLLRLELVRDATNDAVESETD